MGKLTDDFIAGRTNRPDQPQLGPMVQAFISGEDRRARQGIPNIPGAEPQVITIGGKQEIQPVFTGEQQSQGSVVSGIVQPAPTGKIDFPRALKSKTADFSTLFNAAFADDPDTKIRIFAQARFPNLPLPQAIERYGKTQDGEIVFRDVDGVVKPETARTFRAQAKKLASEVGTNSPAIILGTVGSAIGPGGTVLGTSAGELLRKMTGVLVFDEPRKDLEIATDVAKEGLLAFAGEKFGGVFSKVINRILGTAKPEGRKLAALAARDVKFLTPKELKAAKKGALGFINPINNPEEAARIKAIADKHGIELSVAEIADSRELLNRINLLGDLSQSADLIQEFKRTQNLQVQNAVPEFLDTLSKEADPFVVGADISKAANRAVRGLKDARAAATKPWYKKAFAEVTQTDTDKLASDLVLSKNTLATAEAVQDTPDISKMVNALNKEGVPTLQLKGEGKAGHAERILSDFKRIIGEDIPIIKATKNTERITELKTRINNIEKALQGKPTPGFDVPIKTIKVDTEPAIKELDAILDTATKGDPTFNAFSKIRNLIEEADGNIVKLDRLKKETIDIILDKASATPNTKREVMLVKDALVDEMAKISPSYKQALLVHAINSPKIEAAEKSVIGVLSRMNGDNVAGASVQLLASKNSTPETIRRAKALIQKENPEAWNAAIRDFIGFNFEKIKDSQIGSLTNIGGALRKSVFGNEKQRKILKAAMTKEQFSNLSDFMEVLQRTGLTFAKESGTATRQAELKQLERETTSEIATIATSPFRTPERTIADRMNALRFGRGARQLAELMLDPKAAKQLKALKTLSPRSEELIRRLSSFMAVMSPETTESVQDATRTEPILQNIGVQ